MMQEVRKNPFELAAIASASVSNLNITGVAELDDDLGQSALLIDDKGKKWRIHSTLSPEQSTQLDHELQSLKVFTPSIRAKLPFSVVQIIGSLRHADTKSYVYSYLDGQPLDLSPIRRKEPSEKNLTDAENIGHCLAALHNIPLKLLETHSLPCYAAAELRRRKLKELDQAAASGKIPTRLLSRWETTLEDVSLWHFAPATIHGNLREDNILINDSGTTALTAWSSLHGGDPAEDFAWITTLDNDTFHDAVLRSYEQHLDHAAHKQPLIKRANFHAEFALAQWLVEGLVTSDNKKIQEAEEMLNALNTDLRQLEDAATALP